MKHSFSFFSKAFIFVLVPFLLQAQSVKLLSDYPSTIKAGEQFIMAIRITKGQASNAARLQLELPAGFDAKVVNARGGEFSFQNNTVKFFWAMLPDAAEFTVSCNLIPASSLKGKQTITGEFIYGDGDKSEHVPLRPCIINITSLDQSSLDPKSATPKVERKIITVSEQKSEYRVELTFIPNGINESAQFTDILPADFSALVVDAHEASYSFENQSVIFTWNKFPKEKSFVVAYIVRSSTPGASPIINGTLVYGDAIEIATPASASINPVNKNSTITEPVAEPVQTPAEAPSATSENREATPSPSETKQETPPENQPVNTTEPVKENNNEPALALTTDNKNSGKSEDIKPSKASNGSGIVFRVQISATQNSPSRSKEWFEKNYQITSDVDMTSQDGWNKYMIGNCQSINEATSLQNSTREKIAGAFVVAYQNGVRIPVSEAIRNKAINQ